jgi:putative spermidine/putrescine transport system ATP-binding protein/spermidine/putrescine transport system ATP-binding protein
MREVTDHDLELAGVGKVYDNGTPAVVDFNLRVAKGEFIAFLGPSGCGKTTTLRMIAGFETITSGDILIRGRRINDLPPERRPTSMIFQNYALFPNMTVWGNVAFGLEVKGLPRAEREAKVARILQKLGLADVADQRTDRLSGGQRQRIALARGLVVEPDILLLDEPLGALDANLRKAIQAELKLLQRSLGITFVFVTHAQSEALTMSDRVVVMNQGRIEQVSAPHELYTRPKTGFVAQFIGRNTILDGTLQGASSQEGTVATRFGTFAGRPNAELAEGGPAKIVIPSESLEIFAASQVALPGLRVEYGGNVLGGVIERRERVGHLAHLTVQLDDSRSVTMEGHVETFLTDALRPQEKVWITWRPQEATVIAA